MPSPEHRPENLPEGPTPIPAHVRGHAVPAAGFQSTPAGLSPPERPIPPALATIPDIPALLKAFRRRWLVATVAGLLCAGIAAAATWNMMPTSKYSASALLHVATLPPRIIFATADSRGVDVVHEARSYQKTQETMIKSRLVLGAALRKPDVAALDVVKQQLDPIVWLESRLEMSFTGEILRIGMSGNSPQDLEILVNAVTHAYLEKVVDKETTERLRRHERLKEISLNYQESLKEKRRKLRELAETVGSDEKETLTLKQQLAMERLDMAEKELMQVQADLRKAQAELTASRVRPVRPEAISQAELEELIDADPVVKQYQTRITQHRVAIRQFSRRVTNLSDIGVQTNLRDLREMTRALAERRAELRPILAARLGEPGRLASRGPREDPARRIEFLKEYEKTVKLEVDRLSEGTRFLNQRSLDLKTIREEIEQAETASRQVGAEVEALNVEIKAPSRVTLIEDAALPRTKATKRLLVGSTSAAFITFLGVLLSISLLEYRARRIESVDEVVRGLGMRLVGSLPTLPDRARRRLGRTPGLRDQAWQNGMVESIDATRMALMHLSRTESLKVVMITSALGGEGKTSLSCYLAASLARAGKRTILVDSDLRSPTAHRLFELPLGPGLCELLRGEAELADAIRPTPIAGLWMVSAGACDVRALEALSRDGARAIFARLREEFDFVVVDSAPVLPAVDTLLIGQNVDAAIFSILRDVSRAPKVHAAYERLTTVGIRSLGAVVAGTQADHYGYPHHGATPPVLS